MTTHELIIPQPDDDAEKLDKAAEYFHSVSDCAKLYLAATLKFIRDNDHYSTLGFKSFKEYLFERWLRSEAWATKLIGVYTKYCENLGYDPKDIQDISYAKLSMMQSHVTEDNATQTLEDMRTKTQKEISNSIKEKQGLLPNETVTKEKERTLKFTGPDDIIEVIKLALKAAAEEAQSEIPIKALEVMAASYLISSTLNDSDTDELEKMLCILEKAYGITIEWTRNAT